MMDERRKKLLRTWGEKVVASHDRPFGQTNDISQWLDESMDIVQVRQRLREWNRQYCEKHGILKKFQQMSEEKSESSVWCSECGSELQCMELLTSRYMGCPKCEREELEAERDFFIQEESDELAPLGPAIPRPSNYIPWAGWNELTKAKD